jgi:peptidoglycan/LPS O-acetylase OafA/YrhL
MAVINVQNHPELTFCDSIFAFCVLFCLETSGAAQWALGNVVMRWLGKLSAGMYVLAPSIVYAIIPPVAATLNANGTSLSNTLLISWLILFGSGLAFAIVFHFFVELPSKLMGELFCDAIESMETREESRIKSVGGKLIKRNPK